MLDAVLLDTDGTLIDTNGLHLLAWQRALRREGREVDATPILGRLGRGSHRFIAAVLGPDAGDVAQEVRALHGEEYSAKGLVAHAEPLPGAMVLEVPLTLAAQG